MLAFESQTPQQLLREIAEFLRLSATQTRLAGSERLCKTVKGRNEAAARAAALEQAATHLDRAAILPAESPLREDIRRKWRGPEPTAEAHSELEARLAEYYVCKFARETGRPESDYRGKIWVSWDEDEKVYDLRGEHLPAHPDLVATYPSGWCMVDHITPDDAAAALALPVIAPVSPADVDRAAEWQIDAAMAEAASRSAEPPKIPGMPFTVGRNDGTGDVRYYATLAEAEARIVEIEKTDPEGVHRGDYYVDGPEELINPRQPAQPSAQNAFTAVANALAVMVLNHGIRGYLELYDPKAYEQAEAALTGFDPAYAAKIAEARALAARPSEVVEDRCSNCNEPFAKCKCIEDGEGHLAKPLTAEEMREVKNAHPEGKIECYCDSGLEAAGTICMFCWHTDPAKRAEVQAQGAVFEDDGPDIHEGQPPYDEDVEEADERPHAADCARRFHPAAECTCFKSGQPE